MSEKSIFIRTGCMPLCRRAQYDFKVLNAQRYPSTTDLIGGIFYHTSGRYNYKEDYYTYDEYSFFADVGGYLGLILGHGILSFYDIAKATWLKFRC
jgi:hypothetical protein